MTEIVYKKSIQVDVPAEALWDWHQRPGAFERLAPAWQKLIPVDMPETLTEGAEGHFKIKNGPFQLKWRARISEVEAPKRFVDEQLAGPFASWRHDHLMEASGKDQSRLTDNVTYSLPAGLGKMGLFRNLAGKEISRLFAFRHRRMQDDLQKHGGGKPGTDSVVLVSGSTGLIGRRLLPYLRTLGYEVRGLTRGQSKGRLYHWHPASGYIDPEAMEGVTAVIHLAGENIAGGRWTKERRARILNSRVDSTRTLVRAMEGAESRPEVFVSASGANYYGAGAGPKKEDSPAGSGFLADVCQAWETEAGKAREFGIRTAFVRTGIVLDPLGGALGKMLPAFRAGLGGPIGDGKQAFPWIAMDDLLDIYERLIRDPGLSGAVNAVHPKRVTQRTFSQVLAGVLRRPAFLPLPAFVVKWIFGQMGEETLLADLPVDPGVLAGLNHPFRFSELHDALAFMLGKG